jgi:hypothetical protein
MRSLQTWSAIADSLKLRIHLWTSGFFDDIHVLRWLNVQEFSADDHASSCPKTARACPP